MLCFSGCFFFVHVPRLHLDLKKSHTAVCLESLLSSLHVWRLIIFILIIMFVSLNVELLVS